MPIGDLLYGNIIFYMARPRERIDWIFFSWKYNWNVPLVSGSWHAKKKKLKAILEDPKDQSQWQPLYDRNSCWQAQLSLKQTLLLSRIPLIKWWSILLIGFYYKNNVTKWTYKGQKLALAHSFRGLCSWVIGPAHRFQIMVSPSQGSTKQNKAGHLLARKEKEEAGVLLSPQEHLNSNDLKTSFCFL